MIIGVRERRRWARLMTWYPGTWAGSAPGDCMVDGGPCFRGREPVAARVAVACTGIA